jgi:hypothetical protein
MRSVNAVTCSRMRLACAVTLTDAEVSLPAASAVRLPTLSTSVMAPLKLCTFADTAARLPAMSCVPLVCCSTAAAMRAEKRLRSEMVCEMLWMASTERRVTFWIASMRPLISRVALAVCPASVLTSWATTALAGAPADVHRRKPPGTLQRRTMTF